jgi:hypothetical protein
LKVLGRCSRLGKPFHHRGDFHTVGGSEPSFLHQCLALTDSHAEPPGHRVLRVRRHERIGRIERVPHASDQPEPLGVGEHLEQRLAGPWLIHEAYGIIRVSPMSEETRRRARRASGVRHAMSTCTRVPGRAAARPRRPPSPPLSSQTLGRLDATSSRRGMEECKRAARLGVGGAEGWGGAGSHPLSVSAALSGIGIRAGPAPRPSAHSPTSLRRIAANTPRLVVASTLFR